MLLVSLILTHAWTLCFHKWLRALAECSRATMINAVIKRASQLSTVTLDHLVREIQLCALERENWECIGNRSFFEYPQLNSALTTLNMRKLPCIVYVCMYC